MGIFDEGNTVDQSREATVAGIQAIAGVLLLLVLPQVWQGLYPLRSSFTGFEQNDVVIINIVASVIPAILAFLSWRHRAAVPPWIRMLAGGTLTVALILIGVSLLGILLGWFLHPTG